MDSAVTLLKCLATELRVSAQGIVSKKERKEITMRSLGQYHTAIRRRIIPTSEVVEFQRQLVG